MARGRAYRRHQARLAKRRARVFVRYWTGSPPTAKLIGMFATTPSPCSSRCCGNWRKHEGPTRKELLNQQSLAEQKKEAGVR